MNQKTDNLFPSDEKKDLELLQFRLNELAREAMDSMRHAADMSPEQLPHSGHKTNADAGLRFFKSSRKDMDKCIAAHIKKYPD